MVIIKASFDPAVYVMSSPSRTKAEIWSGATVRMSCQPPPDYEALLDPDWIHPDAGRCGRIRSSSTIVMPRHRCAPPPHSRDPRCFLALHKKKKVWQVT